MYGSSTFFRTTIEKRPIFNSTNSQVVFQHSALTTDSFESYIYKAKLVSRSKVVTRLIYGIATYSVNPEYYRICTIVNQVVEESSIEVTTVQITYNTYSDISSTPLSNVVHRSMPEKLFYY